MPPSPAMSKAGKKGHKSSGRTVTPPPQDVKVEENDPSEIPQNNMLMQEDTDETVGEIMVDLMNSVMEGCLQVHNKRQMVALTVSWAKNFLTQTLEQHFMCLDKGEGPDELSVTEDSEPASATTDSWAQGSIPVITADMCSTLTSRQETNVETHEGMEPKVTQSLDVERNVSSRQVTEEPKSSMLVREKFHSIRNSFSPPKTEVKKQLRPSLPLKHDVARFLPSLPCATEPKEDHLKGKDVRKSASDSLTVSSPNVKNCRPIPKLDPLQLPRNLIFPQYEIIDDSHTKPLCQDLSGLSRLSQRHNKQQGKCMLPSLNPMNSSCDGSRMLQRSVYSKKSYPPAQRRQTMMSEALRLDTMTLDKGVSLPKHQAEDLQPLRLDLSPLSTDTRLICSDVRMPLLSVDQDISGPPPQITLLSPSKQPLGEQFKPRHT